MLTDHYPRDDSIYLDQKNLITDKNVTCINIINKILRKTTVIQLNWNAKIRGEGSHGGVMYLGEGRVEVRSPTVGRRRVHGRGRKFYFKGR